MTREHESAAWTGIVSNLTLAVFKGSIGMLADSKALMADALHSASEAVSAISERAPFTRMKKRQVMRRGHSEPMLTIFFTVFLLMGGLQIAVSSILQMTQGNITAPGYMAVVAIVLAIVIKEAVFQIQHRHYKQQSADKNRSYIENHRISLYSSVAALIGIFGAMGGQAWDIPALLYMDPAAALLVSLLILWRGYQIVSQSIYGSTARPLHEEDGTRFIDTVQRVHGVIMVEDLHAHEHGHYISIEAKISVNPRITVLEASDIANRAKLLLMNRFSHVSEVKIQVFPYDPGYPYKSNHEGSDTEIPTLLQ